MSKEIHLFDAVKIETIVEGTGETVILLPGWGCDVDYFKDFSKSLVESSSSKVERIGVSKGSLWALVRK